MVSASYCPKVLSSHFLLVPCEPYLTAAAWGMFLLYLSCAVRACILACAQRVSYCSLFDLAVTRESR